MRYLRWIAGAARPYALPLLAVAISYALLTCCSIGFVYVSKRLVDTATAIFAGCDVAHGLLFWAVAMVLVILMRTVLNALKSYLSSRTEIRMRNALRGRLFDIFLHVHASGAEIPHSGDTVSRLQDDVKNVSGALAVSLPNLLGIVLQFLAAFCFLMYLDIRLALVIVVVVPVGAVAGKLVMRRIRNLTHSIRRSDSRVQSHLQESVQHLALLQSMEYVPDSSGTLDSLQGELYGNEIRRTRFSVISRILVSAAFSAGHAIAFLWGVWGISTGSVTYGMMTAFLQLVGQIQRPVVELGNRMPAIVSSIASIDRIMEIEALPVENVENPLLVDGIAGVRLKNISFAYPGSDSDVFSGFSHDFRPGSRTAVVGPTGVGKSTLIRLLLSFLAPRDGSIEIYSSSSDAVFQMSAQTRCNLVYVPQGNSLFSGTIRDNLLMGNPVATDEQLNAALRMAAADFVFGLPAGLGTPCRESGVGLSEGQAQRIAIARALLRPGSVLLLDEFSSALDPDTEEILLERLTSGLPDRTMIFITHREKVIDYCDHVISLS
ncbi:MAG: ABC transporter ATP-binding protein/permease [Clostridium sp.]|nr:ABC transporter ATP-binding protein/permease [Bacteroides sp.]MCM1198124.1 ABC transporter ATP-binding protein/permease [Clostridium sp.]